MSRTPRPARRSAALAALAAAALATAAFAPGTAASAASAASTDPLTVAYVEVNSNELRTVGDYELADGSNAFDVAIIFAANINHDGTGAVLHLNDQVTATLEDADTQIRPLQDKGIKVTLSLLGNHQTAGFANFPSQAAAAAFADQVAAVVEQYGLDGVDIDDEWVTYGSNGVPAANADSARWLVDALDAKLPAGSIISLYDIGAAAASLKSAPASVLDKLDYIWNPYYGQYNIPAYPGVGKDRLGPAAIDLTQTSATTAANLARRTVDEGYGVYVTYNLTAGDRSSYVSSFTRQLSGQEAVYVG
ncbi:endo-beta-N-acetylglucosaminidase H [Microbacterium sp. AG238]|uniref:endo-beta-N-acetylglucosaminidase H n=1 Tax=Microbacterium sp. AG238 TaxID=2183994 RepID=UPI000E7112E3|nr:endo-beta-N-acetylglucosaminidase H [Microbacterium sp. AG238]RKE59366.1 glycosyl hydrolase family 18 (putative chitinase) [Microbacterium sp. AG238]